MVGDYRAQVFGGVASRPTVVALCGSRDSDRIRQAEADLTVAGRVVLAPFLSAHLARGPLGEAEYALLAALQKAKIALADMVVVVNTDKQVTATTIEEIRFALLQGCPVAFSEPVVSMGLREEFFNAMLAGAKTVEVRRLDPKRLALRPGELIRFHTEERSLLARVATLRHSPSATVLLSGLDPTAVVPGTDRDELSKRLEEIYPGLFDADTPMIAIEVEVLGEVLAEAPERHLPTGCTVVWHAGPPPAGISVTGAAGWLVDPIDGRVLIQQRLEDGEIRFALPGGKPEHADGADLLATLAREAVEESQVDIDTAVAVYLGCQIVTGYPGRPDPHAKARFMAPISLYEPIGPDADDPGHTYRRFMTSFGSAAELLGGSSVGHQEAAAALVAARALGIPVDAPAADGFRDGGDTAPTSEGQPA